MATPKKKLSKAKKKKRKNYWKKKAQSKISNALNWGYLLLKNLK